MKSLGCPIPGEEKRTVPKTVHMPPSLAEVVDKLSKHEQRTVSTFICRIVEEHPVVKTFLQRIGAPTGN
jgi:hypothetical protein